MENIDFNEFKKAGEAYRETPSDAVWDRLEYKLKQKKTFTKVRLYKRLSIAASIIAIASVSIALSIFSGDRDPDMLVLNESPRPLVIEHLATSEDVHFNFDAIMKLNKAYATHGMSTQNRDDGNTLIKFLY